MHGKVCSKCKKFKPFFCFHKDLTKKDKHKTICKECRKQKKFHNLLSNNRRKFDKSIMISMNRAIKLNKSGRLWEKVVGYNLYDIKEHLENQFLEKMDWKNFGSFWWIDKIIPRSAYHYSKSGNELRKCWSLKNLRPLSKIKCMNKKNKVYWKLIEEYNLYDILPVGSIFFEDYEL